MQSELGALNGGNEVLGAVEGEEFGVGRRSGHFDFFV